MRHRNNVFSKDKIRIVEAFERDFEREYHFRKLIQKICIISNILYVTFHLVYLVFFVITGYNVMVYLNVISVSFYAMLFLLIKVDRLDIYVLACGLEIAWYMTFSTIICGFDAGFHFMLLGLCVLAFFTSHFSVKAHNVIRPLHWTIFLVLDYIFLYFYCHYIHEPFYPVTQTVNALLTTAHIVVVFIFIGAFSYFFVSQANVLEKQVLRNSKTDRLTLIGNRKALDDYCDRLENKELYCLSIFDIDDFKKINDEFGHLCGDSILKELAQLALYNKRKDDFVVRFGGEEFIFISKIINNFEDTCQNIDEFRKLVENHEFHFEDKTIKITITIGIEKYKNNYSIYDWFNVADKRLYEGKKHGKNRLVIEEKTEI